MSDLLPCPFCGEATHIHVYPPTCRPETPYNPVDRLFPVARCAKCYAEVAGKNEDYGMKSAIVAWNTRSSQAEIERLKAVLTEARRYVAYLAGDDRTFVGSGMPSECLALIDAALSGSKE